MIRAKAIGSSASARLPAGTALRLSRALGTSNRFWMNLQNRYDLDVQFEAHCDELDKIKSLVI